MKNDQLVNSYEELQIENDDLKSLLGSKEVSSSKGKFVSSTDGCFIYYTYIDNNGTKIIMWKYQPVF